MEIQFFFEQTEEFSFDKDRCIKWIFACAEQYQKSLGDLSFIFTNDEYLLNINKEYLKHDYYTDIITFDYCVEDTLNGEIYISIDRVKENADEFKQTFERELHRVIIHGVLHLIGKEDHTEEEKADMRKSEDECLKKL